MKQFHTNVFLWRTEPQLWFFLSGKQGIHIVSNRKRKNEHNTKFSS